MSVIAMRCTLLAHPQLVDGKWLEVLPEILAIEPRRVICRHFRFVTLCTAGNALIDPLAKAWIHFKISVAIGEESAHQLA